MSESPDSSEPHADASSVDRVAWSRRFGWIVGALVGLAAGFFVVYGVETVLLRGQARAQAVAERAASAVVPLFFLGGALAGHGLGAKGHGRFYKLLGVTAGVLSLTALWVLLSIAR